LRGGEGGEREGRSLLTLKITKSREGIAESLYFIVSEGDKKEERLKGREKKNGAIKILYLTRLYLLMPHRIREKNTEKRGGGGRDRDGLLHP